jgi:hypothetical protein
VFHARECQIRPVDVKRARSVRRAAQSSVSADQPLIAGETESAARTGFYFEFASALASAQHKRSLSSVLPEGPVDLLQPKAESSMQEAGTGHSSALSLQCRLPPR